MWQLSHSFSNAGQSDRLIDFPSPWDVFPQPLQGVTVDDAPGVVPEFPPFCRLLLDLSRLERCEPLLDDNEFTTEGAGVTVMFSRRVARSVVSRLTSLSNLAWRVVNVAASASTLA